jgi:glutaryl-CoA dehydrogenase
MMNRSLLRAAAHSIKAGPAAVSGRRYASSAVFNWEDPLQAAELFTEEELAVQDTARQYCQDKLMPRVLGTYILPPPCFNKMT